MNAMLLESAHYMLLAAKEKKRKSILNTLICFNLKYTQFMAQSGIYFGRNSETTTTKSSPSHGH